jgi:cytochrome P450
MPAPAYPTAQAGRAALKALIDERSLLPALQALHAQMGPIFRLSAPGFRPVVMAGPEANRFLLVEARHLLSWRSESDPVSRLLRNGVLMLDGEEHDEIRRIMTPALHRRKALAAVDTILACTDWVCDRWQEGQTLDMLVEMRRAALLILMAAFFEEDFRHDMERLWPHILKLLKYISPGLWLVWKRAPRVGYERSIRSVDDYLHGLIAGRRARPSEGDDLLSVLLKSDLSGAPLDDELIRDQMLTMLIAGHDTSTALLAWALYLLGLHPEVMGQARSEVDQVLGGEPPAAGHLDDLVYLEQVISEALRLYPPIHVGNRVALEDLDYAGFTIPAGERVMASIYATHRDPACWSDPGRFDPERFAPGSKRIPYSYLPFGGGPRNCIGAAFARVEAKVVLARLLQRFDFTLLEKNVRMYMGATLEPRPGVFMRAEPREPLRTGRSDSVWGHR